MADSKERDRTRDDRDTPTPTSVPVGVTSILWHTFDHEPHDVDDAYIVNEDQVHNLENLGFAVRTEAAAKRRADKADKADKAEKKR